MAIKNAYDYIQTLKSETLRAGEADWETLERLNLPEELLLP